ncbi:putative L,D-transpeptidase YcbB [Xenorhabdus poinarii G6]|uniref:Putative L,D-transpeptidase YcbB n=1 Tax=Xenorhabdus poinarii G6 TaxID=1354304 RepID=A0A068R3J9_9GAMM|nr:L,D-transpeptidase [Xenorhabdus poinarii]CDG21842.1 putative L,D-transpeptidase YcbB [Xenorhabdus poinarii G6]
MAKNTVRLLKVSFISSALVVSEGVFANPKTGLPTNDTQLLSAEQKKENPLISLDKTLPGSPVFSVDENRKKLQSWLPQQIKPIFFERLVALYTDNKMKPLWSDEKAIKQFENQLVEMALAGFQPQFENWLVQLHSPELSDMGRDVILSDAMLGYLHFISHVNQKGTLWLYAKSPYKIELPPSPLINTWQQHISNNNTLSHVTNLLPDHFMYENMRKEMLNQLANKSPWPEFTFQGTLRPGQRSEHVITLRKILARSDGGASSVAKSDSKVYDKELIVAVKRFQALHGLSADGVIGKATKVWLNMTPQTRARIMALNIQRLRIIPGDILTGILVNIPNYSLFYYLDGKEALRSKVVVGRPGRKTPIMSNELNNVVINPPWNVPTSMTRKDIAPRAMRDPSYFSTRGYTVFSSWRSDAKVIHPSSIDWNIITPSRFPYRIRQAPGPTNSLGRFKFNMPNSEAIYLHDTPNQASFSREMRAVSSGCVRVNKAPELANMLLGDAGWDKAKVSGSLKTWSTKYVNIPKKIPVFLYYQTAWVDEEGKPQYRADIYDYDVNARQHSASLSKIL